MGVTRRTLNLGRFLLLVVSLGVGLVACGKDDVECCPIMGMCSNDFYTGRRHGEVCGQVAGYAAGFWIQRRAPDGCPYWESASPGDPGVRECPPIDWEWHCTNSIDPFPSHYVSADMCRQYFDPARCPYPELRRPHVLVDMCDATLDAGGRDSDVDALDAIDESDVSDVSNDDARDTSDGSGAPSDADSDAVAESDGE